MRIVVEELPSENTSVAVDNPALAWLGAVLKLPDVELVWHFIFVVSVAMFVALIPLSFVVLVRGVHDPTPVLVVLPPIARVVGVSGVVVVGSQPFL